MKVSIGSKIVRGPWGGGNLFAINLSNFLLKNGHEVRYDLTEPDIDLILLTDPRSRGSHLLHLITLILHSIKSM